MPKGTKDTRPVSQQLAWVEKLPESGGDWGRGITQTVNSVEAEVADLESTMAAEEEDYRRRANAMRETIRTRRRLLGEVAKRADKEAPMLFANAQIRKAKEQAAANEEMPAPSDTRPTA